ncbi:GNAT family N-acetyltransferase [Serratia plymuthica]|uniref:GNAT family N-acetyltransferase n=1 Tax=Serratia plymuthica TaxID=82996 RepID=UPI00390C8773
MAVSIEETAVTDTGFAALVTALDDYQQPLYPAASCYSVSFEEMTSSETCAFVAKSAGDYAGCGCLYISEGKIAEIKRMYVDPRFRGQGIAYRLIEVIEQKAQSLGYGELYLETGVNQPEAISLYRKTGYRQTTRFGNYPPDPLSIYMMKRLKGQA